MKNVSKYNNGTFSGYRVSIMSGNRRYVRYFSGLRYRTLEETRAAAVRCRDWLRAALLNKMDEATIRAELKQKEF